MDFTITERTKPFILDEVFEFIDDTNISKLDAYELKSRIVDMLQAEKNKAIDKCIKILDTKEPKYNDILNDRYDMIEHLRELKVEE